MRQYRGGEQVETGLYFNLRQLSFKSVDESGPLPGTPTDVYRRVPMLLLLVVGPVLGLVYVVFLPFIGVAMVTWLLAAKAGQFAGEAARQVARVLRPGWEPAMAFFSRSKAAKRPGAQTDPWAEEVRKRLERGDQDGA